MARRTLAVVAALAVMLSAQVGFADGERARRAIDSARELYSAGNWETAAEVYADARKAAPRGSVLEAEATMELASLQWERGEYSTAHTTAMEALKQAQALDLEEAVGRLMLTIGHIEASRGRLSQAENTLNVCVKSATEQQDEVFAALCRINLRFVRQLRGRSVGSEASYRRDLDTLKKSGERVLVGTSLAKSSELQEKQRDFVGALATLHEAQAQFVAAGSVPAQSRNRLRLAQTLQNLGRWDEAAKQLDGLVLDFQNMSNRPSLVTAYALRGKQRAHGGDGAGAMADYNAARKTAHALGSPQLIANTELALCEHFAVNNSAEGAATHCDAANAAFVKVGIPTLAARASILQARLAQSNEDWGTAREQYLIALKLLTEDVAASARDPRELAVQHANLCQVETRLKASGAHSRCLDAERALGAIRADDASYLEMVAATAYSVGVTAPTDQSKRAIDAFTAAEKIWSTRGDQARLAEVLLRRGRLLAGAKSTQQQALDDFTRGLGLVAQSSEESARNLAIQLGVQKGQSELALEKWADADATLTALVGRAKSAGDHYSLAWGYSGLAQARLKTGNRAGAIEALELGVVAAKQAKDAELTENLRANLEKLRRGK